MRKTSESLFGIILLIETRSKLPAKKILNQDMDFAVRAHLYLLKQVIAIISLDEEILAHLSLLLVPRQQLLQNTSPKLMAGF